MWSSEEDDYFEIESSSKWIQSLGCVRVALQFPDTLLSRSYSVTKRLESRNPAIRFFILADTSYGSCCVDSVAAEHARADCLIHYGTSCLSQPVQTIPVKFVFGQKQIDLDRLETAFATLKNCPLSESTKLIFLYETLYHNSADALVRCLRSLVGREIHECALTISFSSKGDSVTSLGRRLPVDFDTWNDVTVIFIGSEEGALLPLWLMTHPNCLNVLHYDPFSNAIDYRPSAAMRKLRKRLFLVESLRDAQSVGIVVGTLGVEHYREAVARLRTLCRNAGKKVYVLSMGKVNVSKMANFSADIEAFVLLSCPFGIILDTSDYHRPLLSMFEAEIALNPARTWFAEGSWSACFEDHLNASIETRNSEDMDFSLISGRLRKPVDSTVADPAGQLLLYTVGSHPLGQRTWTGLDDGVSDAVPVMGILQGRTGIAAHYQSEPS